MTAASLPRFHGIIPPLVSPLLDGDTLDHAGLERVLERVITGGSHGVFILGTTGEGPSLSLRLRQELITAATKLVRRRIPVLVNITDTSYAQSLRLARAAAEAGADAVVASPPPYFPVDQPELLAYFRKLAAAVPLPLLLYQMPSHVKVNIELPTVGALLEEKNIVGIKDTSFLMTYFQQLVAMTRERRPDWSVLVGPEQLLVESVLLGGHGAVCGGANVQPRFFADLFDAALRRDLTGALEMQRHVEKTAELIYGLGTGAGGFITSIKLALSVLGVCGDAVAEPLTPLGPGAREEMGRRLRQLGVTA